MGESGGRPRGATDCSCDVKRLSAKGSEKSAVMGRRFAPECSKQGEGLRNLEHVHGNR